MITALKTTIKRSAVGPALHQVYLKLFKDEGKVYTIHGGLLKGYKWHRFMRTHNDLYVAGAYEEDIQSALALVLKPGMTFLDIGANVGFFSLLGAHLVGESGRVVAFEPHPVTCAQLRRQARLNNRNIEAVEAAVCDKNGTAEFTDDTYSVTASFAKSGAGKTITVRTTTIDEEVSKNGWCPDVFKIDVEGAEIDVLKGAKLTIERFKPTLLTELHSDQLSREYHNIMDANGYRTTPISGDRFVLSVSSAH